MKTMDVAQKLVELCKQGKNLDAINSLYAEDVVSVEAAAMGGQPRELRGLATVRKKSEDWRAMNEVHAASVEGPWPHDDKFIVRFSYDITNKHMNQRMKMDETALYWVKDGKIVREEFFYHMG